MTDPKNTVETKIQYVKDVLQELTEMPELPASPYRFLALIGQSEGSGENGMDTYLNGEMYSAADVEDMGDMLSMLIQMTLESQQDNDEGLRYLIECILRPLSDYLSIEENE